MMDPYCKTFTNNICTLCYDGYYVHQTTNKCVVANNQCKTRDANNLCTECYTGYVLYKSQCINIQAVSNQNNNAQNDQNWNIFYSSLVPFIVSSPGSDPNCKTFKNGVCTECSYRTFPQNGKCMQVHPDCKTYDPSNGLCTTCYYGYKPQGGVCVPNPVAGNEKCPFRSVPINNVCVTVSDQCKKWDAQAKCTMCYIGYTLTNGECKL